MKNNSDFSYEMHSYTEKPGQLLSKDTHKVIKHRYDVAEKFSRKKTVLEIGAGHGIGAKLIAEAATFYVGAEYSSENISLIKNKKLNEKIVQLNAHSLPFCNSSFEIVLALAMIYYLDFDIFIEESKRVLKDNGKIIFCTSNQDVPGFVRAPYTTKYYSIPELKEKLSEHGLGCEFYGAFPKFKKSIVLTKIKVHVRDLARSLKRFIPRGDKIWLHYRNKSLGGLLALPDTVQEINSDEFCWSQNFIKLDDNKIDEQYRVVYCVANMN